MKVVIKEKECRTCKKVKPIGEYYEHKGCPFGIYPSCRECVREIRNKARRKKYRYDEKYSQKERDRRNRNYRIERAMGDWWDVEEMQSKKCG